MRRAANDAGTARTTDTTPSGRSLKKYGTNTPGAATAAYHSGEDKRAEEAQKLDDNEKGSSSKQDLMGVLGTCNGQDQGVSLA